MHWIVASLLSALFLGVYELCTKHAVRDNAVVPVLFFSTLTGAIIWVALLSVQAIHPAFCRYRSLPIRSRSSSTWNWRSSPSLSPRRGFLPILHSSICRCRSARPSGCLGGDEPAPRLHSGGFCRRPALVRRKKRTPKTSRRDRYSRGHCAHGDGMNWRFKGNPAAECCFQAFRRPNGGDCPPDQPELQL